MTPAHRQECALIAADECVSEVAGILPPMTGIVGRSVALWASSALILAAAGVYFLTRESGFATGTAIWLLGFAAFSAQRAVAMHRQAQGEQRELQDRWGLMLSVVGGLAVAFFVSTAFVSPEQRGGSIGMGILFAMFAGGIGLAWRFTRP